MITMYTHAPDRIAALLMMLVGTGLPGFPGVVSPAWLVVFSVAASLRRE